MVHPPHLTHAPLPPSPFPIANVADMFPIWHISLLPFLSRNKRAFSRRLISSRRGTQISIYFAKCKSYPSHFLALTCSGVKPGFPYVNGKKYHHPPITNINTTPVAAHSMSILPCPILSLALTRLLPKPGATPFFFAALLFLDDLDAPSVMVLSEVTESRATGSRLQMNSRRAPVTSAEARCAGR